ncbi:hypothetical protein JYG30_06160 [Fibrella sp. USSR17]
MKSYTYKGWTVQESEQDATNQIQKITNQQTGVTHSRHVDKQSVSAKVWIGLVNQAEASLKRPENEYVRYGIRVLAMVGELHKLGFQRLRIVPYISSSGMYWRCVITTVDRVLTSHGAMFIYQYSTDALYSMGMENKYFDWADAQNDSARELAAKFMQRFPELVERGRGDDWPYAGWYQYMLGTAERGALPYSFDNEHYYKEFDRLPTSEKVTLTMPPGGEAEAKK